MPTTTAGVPKTSAQRVGRRADSRVVRRHAIRRGAVASLLEREGHTRRAVPLEMTAQTFAITSSGRWRGHEPARDLHVRVARQHCLAAGSLIAAVEAVHLDRRPVPLPRERAVARLADRRRCADVGEIARLVERQPLERLEQRRLDRFDIVVEAVDRDASAGSWSDATSAAAACSGLATPPPWRPECRSLRGPRTVNASAARPRALTVMLGTSARHMPPSADSTTSQASASRRSRTSAGRLGAADLFLRLEQEPQIDRRRCRRPRRTLRPRGSASASTPCRR